MIHSAACVVTPLGGGPNGTLIITRDEANGSIDSERIEKLLDELRL